MKRPAHRESGKRAFATSTKLWRLGTELLLHAIDPASTLLRRTTTGKCGRKVHVLYDSDALVVASSQFCNFNIILLFATLTFVKGCMMIDVRKIHLVCHSCKYRLEDSHRIYGVPVQTGHGRLHLQSRGSNCITRSNHWPMRLLDALFCAQDCLPRALPRSWCPAAEISDSTALLRQILLRPLPCSLFAPDCSPD
jgi:hypothetical protein